MEHVNPERAMRRKLVAVTRKFGDLELLVLARKRYRAVINGEDRLIPLEELMCAYGLTSGRRAADE
jgi:hypothetical protein